MAKKSFLGQLAKGFVRSAVNQVGRDGGRVISNQIYGDAHSTPIRNAGGNQQQHSEQVPPIPKRICDFFSIDIHNLSIYTNGRLGQTDIALNNDLGLFNMAEIIAFDGGYFNVSFKSPLRQITPQLADFINHCASACGFDDNGKGVIVAGDFNDMNRGTFSRVYHNVTQGDYSIMIYGMMDGVTITMLNIPQGLVQFGVANYSPSQLVQVPQGAQVDTPSFWNYVGWFLLIAGTCGIGGLIMAIRGYYITKKPTVDCYTMVSHDITKTDMRYRKGYRVIGQYQTKQKIAIPADSLPSYMVEQQKQYGKIYMIIGIVVIVVNVVFAILAKYIAPTQ